jgi:hypothetical protein
MRRVTRGRGQRGAVAVEAALITPLILLLLFGIIEFGLLFKDYLAVTSASRAGVRIASAEPKLDSFAQDAADQVLREGAALAPSDIQEIWVYKAQTDAMPSPGYPVGGDATFANCSVCVKFHVTSTGTAVAYGATTWTAANQNACPDSSARDAVGVYVQYAHSAVTGLIFEDWTLRDHTVMNLEPFVVTDPARPCKP